MTSLFQMFFLLASSSEKRFIEKFALCSGIAHPLNALKSGRLARRKAGWCATTLSVTLCVPPLPEGEARRWGHSSFLFRRGQNQFFILPAFVVFFVYNRYAFPQAGIFLEKGKLFGGRILRFCPEGGRLPGRKNFAKKIFGFSLTNCVKCGILVSSNGRKRLIFSRRKKEKS